MIQPENASPQRLPGSIYFKPNFPTTSLATVYKNVTILKDLGEILELGFSHDSSRYDGKRPAPHPHLVCTGCKKIIDPDLESLEAVTRELSKETGFKILNHRLDFFGLCPVCQKGGEILKK